jgi:surface protein
MSTVSVKSIGTGVIFGGSFSFRCFWASLISATVEDAQPAHFVFTFPSAKLLVYTDITIAGFPLISGSWIGNVFTVVSSVAAVYGDTPVATFGKTGQTKNITNNVINPYFITTWDTERGGSATKTIVIPTTGAGYDCFVNWGDGSIIEYTGNAPTISHVYSTTGIKTIKIRGVFPRIYFNNIGDKLKLLSIEQWGTGIWTSMNRAFYGCVNMVGNYTDTPVLSSVTDMSYMFYGCTSFNQSVSAFNTSKVTSMSYMFYGCTSFNQSVSGINTSNVEYMMGMFQGCSVFNQSFSNFDTSKVTTMINMFANCSVFNQSVSAFNTSKVTNMSNMFGNCSEFNQSVSNFDTSKVTDMSAMFTSCSVFNQSVSTFDTSKVTTMINMFNSCSVFNQSVSTFNTSKVQSINGMFYNCVAFKQSLATFNLSLVTTFTNFATGCNINDTGTSTNYDNTLVSWAAQTPNTYANINFGSSKYSDTGLTARNILTSTYHWTMSDGGHI